MLPGTPHEARRLGEPCLQLSAATLQRIAAAAIPQRRILAVRPLTDGLRNANFHLTLDAAPRAAVLRIYQHDASLCLKELDVMRLVRDAVPVPEVVHAEPGGLEDIPPFCVTRFIEGISFRELKRTGDIKAIAQAAYSAGETLAAIGRFTFPRPGWLSHGPAVTGPLLEGADAVPRFVDLCLSAPALQQRMPADLRARTSDLIWSAAAAIGGLEDAARLVHGDFNQRNLLVREIGGRWRVAAVLDWEYAIAASPLYDSANFLRYERASRPLAEPHFSEGYLGAGGCLPHEWRRLARLLDLTALCESLTRDRLPDATAAELVELVRATVENREPR